MSQPPPNPMPDNPPPISRTPSYIQFVPKRAMASFDNLVVLANYEERLREARRAVWRDRGERPAELDDLWECIEHACRGGLRAGSLAFAVRAGINFFLLMTRINKVPRSYRFTLIRHAVFGAEPFRFAAMLGSFVGIYKLILNALPILLPEPIEEPTSKSSLQSHFRSDLRASQRPNSSSNHDATVEEEIDDLPPLPKVNKRARLSTSAQAHQQWLHKKTRRWYSVFAGAVAGAVAIRCESADRRVPIAQQLFVRGLQGSWNTFSDKLGFSIPHGDVIIFALSCAQILYGFTMRPDTLPGWYNVWIAHASKVAQPGLRVNRNMVRDGRFNMSDIESIIENPGTAPGNLTKLLQAQEQAMLPTPVFGPTIGPCAAIHPGCDSCLTAQVDYFIRVFRWMLPIYGALHFIPMLLFKRKAVWLKSLKMILKATWGTARSSAFLGVFVVIYHSWLCGKRNFYLSTTALRSSTANTLAVRLAKLVPQFLLNFIASKPAYWLGGIFSGLSLFVEEKRRRGELAMYVLPRGLEGAWVMARGKGYIFGTGSIGDILLSSISMGMVMSIYQNDPEHLSGLVRRILYQFVGPN